MLHKVTNTDERVTRIQRRHIRMIVCFNLGAHEHLRGLPLPPRRDRKAHNELRRCLQVDKAESLLQCSEAYDDDSAARSDNPAVNQSVSAPRLQSFRVARFYSAQDRKSTRLKLQSRGLIS